MAKKAVKSRKPNKVVAQKKAASKAVAAKSAAAKPRPAVSSAKKPRRLKQPRYKTLRLQKRIRHPMRLPNIWRLSKLAVQLFWQHKGLLIGVTLVYGLLNVILAQSLSNTTDVSSLKQNLGDIAQGNISSLASSVTIFVSMVGTAGNTSSDTAGAYQLFLALVGSLAIVWALRQVMAGSKKIRIRDAYYRGMYPLVPFVLIICVIGLQCIPLLVGSVLYNLVTNTGIAAFPAEKFLWGMLYGLLSLLTFYMLASSIFALYIVTLPNMTPVKALRSARELVRYRRWTVMRKLLWLPVLLLLVAAVIMLPIIILVAPLARWVFFILTMFVLVAVHTYIYTLYRELLHE